MIDGFDETKLTAESRRALKRLLRKGAKIVKGQVMIGLLLDEEGFEKFVKGWKEVDKT